MVAVSGARKTYGKHKTKWNKKKGEKTFRLLSMIAIPTSGARAQLKIAANNISASSEMR